MVVAGAVLPAAALASWTGSAVFTPLNTIVTMESWVAGWMATEVLLAGPVRTVTQAATVVVPVIVSNSSVDFDGQTTEARG